MEKNATVNESNTLSVRAAVVDDAQAISEIYNHYVRSGGATFDTVPWTAEQVVEAFAAGPSEVWLVAEDSLAEDGASVVGWSSARRFSTRPGYRLSLESAIYLSPPCSGKASPINCKRHWKRPADEGAFIT